MARQVGLLKLAGRLGDISFYKAVYGYLARTKTGVDRKTVLTDPRFQRTRENAQEFGRAAKGGKLLRNAIRPLLIQAKDTMTVQRLTQKFMKVLQADALNRRGMRRVTDGDMELLNGFDFNIQAKLNSILQIRHHTTFNREGGIAILHLQRYNPKRDINAPKGTSHFKIVFGAAALNFEQLKFIFDKAEGGMHSYDGQEIPLNTMACNLLPNLTLPIVMVLGILFYQEVNGTFNILDNGRFNALGVVGSEG